METICRMEHIKKTFGEKTVLDDFSMEVHKGEFVCITGPSGSGKSTILNMIGMFERPDAGSIELFQKELPALTSREGKHLMRNKLLYLFQNYALVDQKSIEYNLEIPMLYRKDSKEEKKKAKLKALEQVGLSLPLEKKIYQLSGGEQQRVAIARGFLKEFELILADEPTGSLDAANRDMVMSILKQFNEQGKTIILVSHDEQIIESCSRVIRLNSYKC